MKKGIVALLLVLLLVALASVLVSCGTYEYTVKYYYETPDGTYAEKRIERVETAESLVNFEPAAVENYTVNQTKSKLTADLSADENAVIEVYYDAARHTVTFDIGALTLVSGELSQTVFHGEAAVAPVVSGNDKASFVSWDTAFTKVEGDITVKAVTNTDATVKVYHKIENADGSYATSLADTLTVDASRGAYTYEPSAKTHYTVNSAESSLTCTPSIREAASVTVCYTRKHYTVRYELSGLTHTGGELSQSVKYGCAPTPPTFEQNDACLFIEWDKSATAPVEGDTVITAVVNSTAYVLVKIYRETPDGQFVLCENETVNLQRDAREGSYTYLAPSVTGYALNATMSTLSGALRVNNTTELAAYYSINRYTVTFVIGDLSHTGGELTQTVAHGEAAVAPTVANTAKLAFVRWDKAFDSVEGDLTVTAVTTTDAPVEVITYKETADGSYVKDSTETIYVDATSALYTHAPVLPDHYTLNATMSSLSVEPTVLETKTVEVYLDLARYTVTFVIGDLSHTGGELTQTVKYGEAAVAPTVANTAKLAFVRWDKAFDSVEGDLTVTAVTTTDAPVEITVYKENLSGQYVKDSTETIYVDASQLSYTYSPLALAGYTVNATKSGLTVEPTVLETKTVEVYYDLKTYTVTFNIGELQHTDGALSQTVKHGGAAVAPTVSGTRTEAFAGWSCDFSRITSDLTVTAQVTRDAKVIIKYYYEMIGGGYEAGTTETKTVSAIPEIYTHAPASVSGYTLSKTYGNTSCALYAGRESTVEIYYDLVKYTVTFVIGDLALGAGELVQQVPYGTAATAPTVENTLTAVFLGWDKSFNCITSNLTVTAKYEAYTPIYSRADLELIAVDLNGNYILANDINLSGADWTPLGTFTGKFLGNGKVISGLTITNLDRGALFRENKGLIDGVTLKDCTLSLSRTRAVEHSETDTNEAISGAFLVTTNKGTVQNCKIVGVNIATATLKGSHTFTLLDNNKTTYKHVASYYVGGLVAYNEGDLVSCGIEGTLTFTIFADTYYKGHGGNTFTGGHWTEVHALGHFGGFASQNSGTVESCTSTAAIKAIAKANVTADGIGANEAYARTYLTFGTAVSDNAGEIISTRTLAGTIERVVTESGSSSAYGDKDDEAHPSIQSVTSDENLNKLVGSNSGTIIGSVATTS